MFAKRRARLARRTLTEAVVDLSIRSDAVVKGDRLPMIGELKSHLESLDSVLLVYHQQREKRTTRSDHIHVVFKQSVDADTFLRTWLLWDEGHVLKKCYALQRAPHFLNGDISRLEQEINCIRWAVIFQGSDDHSRFKGPAFVALNCSESGEATSLELLEKECACLDFATMDQAFRRVDLEDTLDVLFLEHEKAADKNADLKAQVAWYKNILSEVQAQRSDTSSRK